MPGAVTTAVRAQPSGSRLASTWPIMDRPAMGCSTFGKADFIRVPLPAASMTAAALASAMIRLITCDPVRGHPATAPPALQVTKSGWQHYGGHARRTLVRPRRDV